MQIEPVAYFKSPLSEKFGLPRQSGLVEELRGRIVFEKPYRNPEVFRGIEGFDYLWLIWNFNLNRSAEVGGGSARVAGESAALASVGQPASLVSVMPPTTVRGSAMSTGESAGAGRDFSMTVRPPRLGGNERVGIFASRSPYRPNPLGLSCVRLLEVDLEHFELVVGGADLADGTPIFDIKPYVEYCDSKPGARSGFVDESPWERLEVVVPPELSGEVDEALIGILSEDPRPQYQKNSSRSYGLSYNGRNVRFHVADKTLIIDSVGCIGAK